MLLFIERTYSCYEGPGSGQSSPSWLESYSVPDDEAKAALASAKAEIARLPQDKRGNFNVWLKDPNKEEPLPKSLRKLIKDMADACTCC